MRRLREAGHAANWSETITGQVFSGQWLAKVFWTVVYVVLGALLAFTFICVLGRARNVYPDFGIAIRIVTVSFGLIVLAMIGCRLAIKSKQQETRGTQANSVIAGDRPIANLWGKWLATLRHYRRALIALLLLFLISCTYINVTPLAWSILPLMFVGQVWLIGNIGLFLSLRPKSTGLAIYLVWFTLFGIIAIASILSYSRFYFDPEELFEGRLFSYYCLNWFEFLRNHGHTDIDDWANPPQSWWHLLRINEHYRHSRPLPRECANYSIAIVLHCLVGTYFLLLSTRLVRRPKTSK